MRFGHFLYPMKFDDSRDAQEILACLDEAQLVEELGMDAIWFAEHYFTGECVYGDPLVFASAVAVKTNKIMLGFGILELPLHNPVRVATQTALLDNLSKGRLVVGTGRGSNYNAYEYVGFGTTTGLGAAQLDEAEELLIKAWTEDNVTFKGQFFDVSFPSVRPRPYQKPHPPLARACTGDASLVEMANRNDHNQATNNNRRQDKISPQGIHFRAQHRMINVNYLTKQHCRTGSSGLNNL